MTDFTHHTPRLLTDEDAAADLAGVARPSQGLRLLYDYGQAITVSGDSEEIYMHYAAAREYIKAIEAERDDLKAEVANHENDREGWTECAIVMRDRIAELEAERDELASRVRELEGAIDCVIVDCLGLHHSKKDRHTFNEPCPVEGRIRAALNASKEKP